MAGKFKLIVKDYADLPVKFESRYYYRRHWR